jgi:TatD DNase family protein
MKLFDSHVHLDMEPLKNDIQAAVERAHKAGVDRMINIGSSLRGSRASVEISSLYPNIWASVGLHPHDVEAISNIDRVIKDLTDLAKNEKVVAIGEIGLDYFNLEKDSLKKDQKNLFCAQLDLASSLNLPVIIHTRDAEEDTINILDKYKLRGVIHCYTGKPEYVQKFLDLGYFIGFTGFITFDQEKFNHIREAVKIVPIERLLIETDSPFLAPEPYRGESNEPSYVIEIAKRLAQLKGLDIFELADTTYRNANKLFDLN